MRLLAALTLSLLLSGTAAASNPNVTVSIVATDPVSPAALHNTDNVYVHVHYVSDAPIKIWVRPFSGKAAAPAINMGSPVYPAGEGEAFGWFSCFKACHVDSIHLQLATADASDPFRQDVVPVDFTWDGVLGKLHTPAAWVKPLQDAEQARETEAYNAELTQPLGKSGVIALILFGALLLATLFVCVIWPIYAMIKWRGRWRWLPVAPLVLFVAKTLGVSADLGRDPTSHNLLPFEFLIVGALSAIYMTVIWLLRRRANRNIAQ